MIVKINSKPIDEVLPPAPVKRVYSDAEGYAVMITGFAIVAFLLKYWGWLW